jgi:hypothetical protein
MYELFACSVECESSFRILPRVNSTNRKINIRSRNHSLDYAQDIAEWDALKPRNKNQYVRCSVTEKSREFG